jgi:hypothetical protein
MLLHSGANGNMTCIKTLAQITATGDPAAQQMALINHTVIRLWVSVLAGNTILVYAFQQ